MTEQDFLDSIELQMEHLHTLYGCTEFECCHETHYEGILCGLDNRISAFLDEIEVLNNKLKGIQ